MTLATGPHRPGLDDFTPSEIRVIAEYMLYTMGTDQRGQFAKSHPDMYFRLYGVIPDSVIDEIAGKRIASLKSDIFKLEAEKHRLEMEKEDLLHPGGGPPYHVKSNSELAT